jgi:hypothetical protein
MMGQANLHAADIDRFRGPRAHRDGGRDGLDLVVVETALAIEVGGPGPRVECSGGLVAAPAFHRGDSRQQMCGNAMRPFGGGDRMAADLAVGPRP